VNLSQVSERSLLAVFLLRLSIWSSLVAVAVVTVSMEYLTQVVVVLADTVHQ
jgi:hypothetical protein